MRILAQLLTEITGPRQQVRVGVDFEWSHKSLTHNFFRTIEVIFGRRFGIKAESSASRCDNGRWVQYAHSWEAVFAIFETQVREALSFKLKPFRIYIPLFQTPQGIPVPASPYLFAIAFDNSATVSSVSNISTAYTCTGSNGLLVVTGSDNTVSGDFPANPTYNSVNCTSTILNSSMSTVGGNFRGSFYYLLGPATGSNTFALTWVGTPNNGFCFLGSYSGVSQSGFPDSSATGNGASATSWAATTTVVAANCWLVAMSHDGSDGACTVSPGSVRQGSAVHGGFADSNGTVGTGSQSLTFTPPGSTTNFWHVVSFAPVASATTSQRRLMLMGVGQ